MLSLYFKIGFLRNRVMLKYFDRLRVFRIISSVIQCHAMPEDFKSEHKEVKVRKMIKN